MLCDGRDPDDFERSRMMPKTPDRKMLSRLVDASDQISEESLGMGDPDFHKVEDQLYNAILESPYRAVIKNGNIYLCDENGPPGETILVDPVESEDLDDPEVLDLDES
jgi:hypothetical protein